MGCAVKVNIVPNNKDKYRPNHTAVITDIILMSIQVVHQLIHIEEFLRNVRMKCLLYDVAIL